MGIGRWLCVSWWARSLVRRCNSRGGAHRAQWPPRIGSLRARTQPVLRQRCSVAAGIDNSRAKSLSSHSPCLSMPCADNAAGRGPLRPCFAKSVCTIVRVMLGTFGRTITFGVQACRDLVVRFPLSVQLGDTLPQRRVARHPLVALHRASTRVRSLIRPTSGSSPTRVRFRLARPTRCDRSASARSGGGPPSSSWRRATTAGCRRPTRESALAPPASARAAGSRESGRTLLRVDAALVSVFPNPLPACRTTRRFSGSTA